MTPHDEETQPNAQSCPLCGGRAVPIVYGFPADETMEASIRGEVALGGCCVADDMPTDRCADCGHGWGSLMLSPPVTSRPDVPPQESG